ncbi:MAG: DinB family protein [Dinghuibacter sp.]|nr:DinB family protein [Dinghuibacter sp.]
MTRTYRKGAIGALADEYEQVLNELATLLDTISEKDFAAVLNPKAGKNFQSVKSIVRHVLKWGFYYTDLVRTEINLPVPEHKVNFRNREQAKEQMNALFQYTLEACAHKKLKSRNNLLNIVIQTSWTTYDAEALLEHAIVHVMRHRRQIERITGAR